MKDNITKYMVISFTANFFLSILKLFFGIISNTKSLIADGIHSFSDLTTDLIAIIGNKLSKMPADDGHPKGHGKIEYITSLIISCFIIFLSGSLFKNSFSNTAIISSKYLIIIIVITIIIKYFLSAFLIKKGEEFNNIILISSGKESYTDVYSSFLVLIIIILSYFSKSVPIFKYLDMVGSILISILIFFTGAKLLFKSLSLLIGEKEDSKDVQEKVKKIIFDRKENFELNECTLYKLGSYYEVFLTILVDGKKTIKEGHKLMDEIENDLLNSNLNIEYVTIHIEPIK